MDFAITGKQIKASTNPLNPSLTTPAKKTSKKLVPKTPQVISKPTPAAVLKVSPPQIKKIPPTKDAPATKKQEIKQEPLLRVQNQQTSTDKKQTKTVQQEEEPKLEEEQIQDVIGSVVIRYNHYKQKFPTQNGVLSFVPIQQKYGFSDLFKGNFIPVIKTFKGMEEVEPERTGAAIQFSWKVDAQIEYRLEIQEDEQEEAKYEKKIYKAPTQENKCPCPLKKNKRVQQITEQLKNLRPEQYGTELHKRLLEQRDVEDVLYS